MIQIHNLRPSEFTMEMLDDELQCMAMIRALPEEYRHVASSLLLMEKLDKDLILQAFRAEELNRQHRSEIVDEKVAKAAKGAKGHHDHQYIPRKPGQRDGQQHQRAPGNAKCHYHNGHSYPEWMKDQICHNCGKKGHWAKDCKESCQCCAEPSVKAEGVVESAGNASTHCLITSSSLDIDSHWNTDTGATSHMTPHKHWIHDYRPYHVPIRLANDEIIYSEGVGTVIFRPRINGLISRDIAFTKVLHVPKLQNNLLAVLHLTQQKGFDVHIKKGKMTFSLNHKTLFVASISERNIGYLDGYVLPAEENIKMSSTLPLDLTLWHRRMAHHNYDGIRMLMKEEMVTGMELNSKDKPDPICEPCLAGKMHANPFPPSEHRAVQPLELIHTDTHYVGITSQSGFQYWVVFIDDYTRFRVAVPMRQKSDTFGAFKRFKAYAENQTGYKIKALRDDKGGEYMSNEFQVYLDECGIVRDHTVRNRPQQ